VLSAKLEVAPNVTPETPPLKVTLEPSVVAPFKLIILLTPPNVEPELVIVLVPVTVKFPVLLNVVALPRVTLLAIVKVLPVNVTVEPVVFNVAQVALESVTLGEPEDPSKNTLVLDATVPAPPAPPDEDAQLDAVDVSQVPLPPTQYAFVNDVGVVI
jgi:hypothetical protein